MYQQQLQQPTPEQQKQIQKAKRTLWIGITLIVVFGLAVALYFVFLPQSSTVDNVNVVININTNSTYPTLAIKDVLQTPNAYNNKLVCLSGYYSSSFEYSALASLYTILADGSKFLVGEEIWIDASVPQESLECENDAKYGGCFGEVVVCGRFLVADSGGVGYGHLGVYDYALQPEDW